MNLQVRKIFQLVIFSTGSQEKFNILNVHEAAAELRMR